MNVTLITGASNGIGEAFAKRLAKEKHNLLLVARTESKLKTLCRQLNEQYNIDAQYIAIDLAKEESSKIISDEVAKRNLQIDCLINNAGIGNGGDFLEYTLEDYQNMMNLNMNAMVALTYQFLPQMRSNKNGTIINVGSMAGFNPIPYMNVYAATKGFVKYFTEALWEENRLFNVQTMLLCPGATETGFFDAAKIGSDRKRSYSTRKLETPEQVVNSAMKGLQKRSLITISGLQNKISHRLFSPLPNKFMLKAIGRIMRKNIKFEIK